MIGDALRLASEVVGLVRDVGGDPRALRDIRRGWRAQVRRELDEAIEEAVPETQPSARLDDGGDFYGRLDRLLDGLGPDELEALVAAGERRLGRRA